MNRFPRAEISKEPKTPIIEMVEAGVQCDINKENKAYFEQQAASIEQKAVNQVKLIVDEFQKRETHLLDEIKNLKES